MNPEHGTNGSSVAHISDTARWVAMYRAIESERRDALFQDPYARDLAGERGEIILRTLHRGAASAAVFAVRTRALDDMLESAIKQHGIQTVVNLAAGLDTRPFRLASVRDIQWVDVDLPDILDYKCRSLAARTSNPKYRTLAADLASPMERRAMLAEIAATSPAPILALSEGFLIYLSNEQVRALARDLQSCKQVRFWLIDLVSPLVLRLLRRTWSRELSAGDAHLRFGPATGADFFQPLGWRPVQRAHYFREAHRLGREAWHARLLGPLSRRVPAVGTLLDGLGGYFLLQQVWDEHA